jgi:hypothetical protein
MKGRRLGEEEGQVSIELRGCSCQFCSLHTVKPVVFIVSFVGLNYVHVRRLSKIPTVDGIKIRPAN